MTTDVADLAETLCGVYSEGGELMLLFDFDGTLAPIVEHPDHAVLQIGVRRTLEILTRLPRIHVGVISGRELKDLKARIGISNLFLAGTGGLELDFRGVCVTHPRAGTAVAELVELATSLRNWPLAYPGLWIQTKRLGITIHFRQVCPGDVENLVQRLRGVLARFQPSLQLIAGPMAIEVVPSLGWNKGSAVRLFLNSIPATKRLVLFAGDSENDIDAFEAVSQVGGVTVGVGVDVPGFPSFQFSTPAELHTWLTCLVSTLSQMHTLAEAGQCS